jgi:hypothetical protein
MRNTPAATVTIGNSRITDVSALALASILLRLARRSQEKAMFVTLVAILCHSLAGGPGRCVEEIITDSSKSEITFQSCVIQGQIGVAKWMSEHPIYRVNWTLQRYKCALGHYIQDVKA